MSTPENQRWSIGFGESMAIIAAIVMLGAFVLPSFIKARATSSANACINNLRQIDNAANQFALEHNLAKGAPINFPDDLTPYIHLNSAGKIPGCPAGGLYSIWRVGQLPKCTLGATNAAHSLQ